MSPGESSIMALGPRIDEVPIECAADPVRVSFVLPCLNESRTIAMCIAEATETITRHGWIGEVVVADNGSTDGSQDLAARAGAVVVHVKRRGYGAAIQGGVDAARGTYVVIGDADGSYDFTESAGLVERLRAGADLAIGSRFRGHIQPGAMPPLHRHLGNPILSRVGRMLFGIDVSDFHCGLRAARREVLRRLPLMCSGMEYATEMIVRARQHGCRLDECPVTLRPDGRGRRSHLRPWRDGWRHLRLMVLL
ncbi:MAG: glycosyltransferase family 2 protein, partial [Phycisphaerales bacterium]|nr:glycosyltransferase family 2 protein [Phycisphaerales bacterium]